MISISSWEGFISKTDVALKKKETKWWNARDTRAENSAARDHTCSNYARSTHRPLVYCSKAYINKYPDKWRPRLVCWAIQTRSRASPGGNYTRRSDDNKSLKENKKKKREEEYIKMGAKETRPCAALLFSRVGSGFFSLSSLSAAARAIAPTGGNINFDHLSEKWLYGGRNKKHKASRAHLFLLYFVRCVSLIHLLNYYYYFLKIFF